MTNILWGKETPKRTLRKDDVCFPSWRTAVCFCVYQHLQWIQINGPSVSLSKNNDPEKSLYLADM